MPLRILPKLFFVIVLALVCQVTGTDFENTSPARQGQLKSFKVVSPETYNRVLDMLFPRGDSGIVTIVLRFEPSFQPESQITIRSGQDKSEVIEYKSLSGNIYSKLSDVIAHGGKEDAVEMAKLIKVGRRSIEVPYAQVKQWHARFLVSVSDSLNSFKGKIDEYDTGTSTIALDGTFYYLWYKQISNEISFKLYDHEVNSQGATGDFKLVQWMNIVRREVERLN